MLFRSQGSGLKGEVLEDTDHYYILGRRGEPVTISTFALEPVRRIATDEGDIIDADVTTTCGRTYRGVRWGLQPGETVVVDGVMAVRNGQKLDPKPLEEPKAAEPEAAAPAN